MAKDPFGSIAKFLCLDFLRFCIKIFYILILNIYKQEWNNELFFPPTQPCTLLKKVLSPKKACLSSMHRTSASSSHSLPLIATPVDGAPPIDGVARPFLSPPGRCPAISPPRHSSARTILSLRRRRRPPSLPVNISRRRVDANPARPPVWHPGQPEPDGSCRRAHGSPYMPAT